MRRASGTLHVFTFKDGLLARAAHDLRLGLEDFSVLLDGNELRAEFDLRSLVVEGAIESGTLVPYDAARRAEVAAALHDRVLKTTLHPTARFRGTAIAHDGGFDVHGELELVGRTGQLSFAVRRDGDRYRAELELEPSRWGIAPYRALLGAIRVKDSVRLELVLQEVS